MVDVEDIKSEETSAINGKVVNEVDGSRNEMQKDSNIVLHERGFVEQCRVVDRIQNTLEAGGESICEMRM